MIPRHRRIPLLFALVAFLALGTADAGATISPPSETGPQVVPLRLDRVFATANAKLDIDGLDDERVDVDIAVLDTGLKLDHLDLNIVGRTDCTAAGWPEYECTSASPDDGDDNEAGVWHGTHVAANLAGLDNDLGGVGMAAGARLWAVDVHGDEVFNGSNDPQNPLVVDLETVIAGVHWVTERADEIEVAYLSSACDPAQEAAGPQPTCTGDAESVDLVEELELAVQEAIAAGIVVVSPAGNWNSDTATLVPQRFDGMLIASAMTDSDGKPGGKGSPLCKGGADDTGWGANWGEKVDVTASGCSTSGAGPQLTAAAAILASQDNPEDAGDVEEIGAAIFGGSDCADPESIGTANCEWTDNSGDGVKEPLLDLHDEEVFDPETVPGKAWIGKPVPNAGGGVNNDNRLTDVSCASASFCFATANLIAAEVNYAYGSVWDGSTWKLKGGLPENSGTVLSGVSCASSTSCIAVGHEVETNGVFNLAVSWDGTKWTRLSVPYPEGTNDNRIVDVSCPSASFCFATGNLVFGGVSYAYGSVWNGSTWTHVGGLPENSGTVLSGVSCTSSTSCIAVGHEVEENGVFNLAVTWDGTKWTRLSVPSSGLANDNRLTDIDCTAASFCLATANLVDNGVSLAYAGVWNGSSWVSVGAIPDAEATTLSGVSCASSTSCTAVGHRSEGGEVVSYAARWSGGTSWTREELQSSAGATDSRLSAVSCATDCVAVGNYTDAGGVWNLAEHAPEAE